MTDKKFIVIVHTWNGQYMKEMTSAEIDELAHLDYHHHSQILDFIVIDGEYVKKWGDTWQLTNPPGVKRPKGQCVLCDAGVPLEEECPNRAEDGAPLYIPSPGDST
jgi:hypothetical protein